MEKQAIQNFQEEKEDLFRYVRSALYFARQMIGEELAYGKNLNLQYQFAEMAFETKLSPMEALDWLREKATNPDIIARERTVLICRYALHPEDKEALEMLEDDINMGSEEVDMDDLSSLIDSKNLSNSYLNEKEKFIRREVKGNRPTTLFDAGTLDFLYEIISAIEESLPFEEKMAFIGELAKNPDMDFLHRLSAGIHYLEDPTNPDTKMVLKETIEKYSSSDVKEGPSKQKKFYPYPIK